jgi:hypothetical protein
MVIRTLASFVALAVAAATPAFAGFGTTATLGSPMAPTFDYRANGIVVQLPLLHIVGDLASGVEGGPDLGVTASKILHSRKIAEETEGVFMPGLGLMKTRAGTDIHLQARVGGEMKKGAGFGLYVVPQLGYFMSSVDGVDGAVTTGGTVEFSAWFAK